MPKKRGGEEHPKPYFERPFMFYIRNIADFSVTKLEARDLKLTFFNRH